MAANGPSTRIETKVYAGPGIQFEVRQVSDLAPDGAHTGRTMEVVVRGEDGSYVELFLTPYQLEALGDVVRAAGRGRRQP